MIEATIQSIIDEIKIIKKNNPSINPLEFEGILEDCYFLLDKNNLLNR